MNNHVCKELFLIMIPESFPSPYFADSARSVPSLGIQFVYEIMPCISESYILLLLYVDVVTGMHRLNVFFYVI